MLHVGSESQGQQWEVLATPFRPAACHRINSQPGALPATPLQGLHTQDNGIGNADVHMLCWGMLGSVERHGRILVHETRRRGHTAVSPCVWVKHSGFVNGSTPSSRLYCQLLSAPLELVHCGVFVLQQQSPHIPKLCAEFIQLLPCSLFFFLVLEVWWQHQLRFLRWAAGRIISTGSTLSASRRLRWDAPNPSSWLWWRSPLARKANIWWSSSPVPR